MKFFILYSFIWTSFSVIAETIHHSAIPQEDLQYLNQDIKLDAIKGLGRGPEETVLYGCNSRIMSGLCTGYCRPPNPQDQNIIVTCQDIYKMRLEQTTGSLKGDRFDVWVPIFIHTGIGISSEEAQEEAMDILRMTETLIRSNPGPFGNSAGINATFEAENRVIEAVKMYLINKELEFKMIEVSKSNPRCTKPRVCVKIRY